MTTPDNDGTEVVFTPTGAHDDCAPKSPCRREDTSQHTGIPMPGIKGRMIEGEIYLSREDVLAFLAATMQAYHDSVHNAAEDDREQRFVGTIGMNVVNVLGAQLSMMTREGNAIEMSVPDSLEGLGWDSVGTSTPDSPAPESAIETAIRKAKENAEAIRKAKDEEGA